MTTKAGFITVVGQTNAGKSTLMNALVGQKVSIVSHKVQTTRFNIRGILTTEKAQMVFVDTPGIFKPNNKRDKEMIRQAYDAISEVELILWIVDVTAPLRAETEKLQMALAQTRTPVFLILNKVDQIHPKEKLLEFAQSFSEKMNFTKVFMIDSLHKKGLDRLISEIENILPESPQFYESDSKTDLPMSLSVSEAVREQVYAFVHQEIPYGISVRTEKITENDGILEIQAVVYVAREGYKKIVLGEAGHKIKTIGEKARKNLQEILNRKLRLFLFVKTDEKLLSRTEGEE